MDSREHIAENLRRSRELTLIRVEDMREHCMVPSTPGGGPHTLWVLGHLAYIEGLVIGSFMRGEANPLAGWADPFDGAEVSLDPADYPSFDTVLRSCRKARETTLAVLGDLTEAELDRAGSAVPEGWEDAFGTYRRCLQYVADHWHMHRGHLADARRAAGLDRMWI